MQGAMFSLKMCSSGMRGGKMHFKAGGNKFSVVVSQERQSTGLLC